MAKITKPLTNSEIKQAKPKDKDYALLYGGGLQLRVKLMVKKVSYFTIIIPLLKNERISV